jgi:hypothetical protein
MKAEAAAAAAVHRRPAPRPRAHAGVPYAAKPTNPAARGKPAAALNCYKKLATWDKLFGSYLPITSGYIWRQTLTPIIRRCTDEAIRA